MHLQYQICPDSNSGDFHPFLWKQPAKQIPKGSGSFITNPGYSVMIDFWGVRGHSLAQTL